MNPDTMPLEFTIPDGFERIPADSLDCKDYYFLSDWPACWQRSDGSGGKIHSSVVFIRKIDPRPTMAEVVIPHGWRRLECNSIIQEQDLRLHLDQYKLEWIPAGSFVNGRVGEFIVIRKITP